MLTHRATGCKSQVYILALRVYRSDFIAMYKLKILVVAVVVFWWCFGGVLVMFQSSFSPQVPS
jgi:hypothetical protein